MRSESTKLMLLNSFFSAYSLATSLDPYITKQSMNTMNTANKILSPAEHFSNPGVPLSSDVMIRTTRAKRLTPYFFQMPWLFSYLTIDLTVWSLLFFAGSLSVSGRPLESTLSFPFPFDISYNSIGSLVLSDMSLYIFSKAPSSSPFSFGPSYYASYSASDDYI